MNRRQFLTRTTALSAGALLAPRWAYSDDTSKRLNIAVIGANGKGASDTKNVALDHNIVALVDVDTKRLDDAVKGLMKTVHEKNPNAAAPKTFTDFRKMFETMNKEIDGVIISTPDHTHFSASCWALRYGKHICVQKPLTNTIWEARELHRLAKEAKVVTQMGNQGRTMEGQRQVKEWIEQGAIGTLKEVRLWTNRPIWPQGPLQPKEAAAPANIDWDVWQAQAAARPYFEFEVKGKDGKSSTQSIHPFKWRGWWEYGSGALGDMGCHIMDATFNILGRRVPDKIDVESGPITELCAPNWSKLVYHMAAAGKYNAMKVTWHDGSIDGKQNKPENDPRIPKETFDKSTSGMIFIGSDGAIMDETAYCGSPKLFPKERAADKKFEKTEERSPKPGNPQLEWAYSIVNNLKPSSNFDYAVPLTEFVWLGNLAIRAQKSIQWDTAAMKVTNVEEANKYVKRATYRQGW